MSDSPVMVKRATADDLVLVQQAIAEINLPASHGAGPLDDRALRAFLSQPAHYVLLAVAGQKVLGCLYGNALWQPYRASPQLFLYSIDVRPEYSGQGVGTALVRCFIAEARRAGACEVWVITNRQNRAAMTMYTRCGLRPQADDDVVLTLAL